MEHPEGDFHADSEAAAKKPGFVKKPAFPIYDLRLREIEELATVSNQPRVRERIMKLSNVYSATCHHRYWSER